jgi:hypothetical protein
LRQLTANLLRITRGAGRPYEVFKQALQLLEACKEFREQLGYPPDPEFSQMLNTAPEFDAPDGDHALHSIVCGALQTTASRLLDQRLQIKAGERELSDGIRQLERARAERHGRAPSATREPRARPPGATIERRLGDRDRELMDQRNERATTKATTNLGQLGAAFAVSPRTVARSSRELHRHRSHKIRQDGERGADAEAQARRWTGCVGSEKTRRGVRRARR